MEPILLLFIGFLSLILGAVVAIATHRLRWVCSWASFSFVLLSAVCFFYIAILVFTGGPVIMTEPLIFLPGVGSSLTIAIDPLSALLLLIISIISTCTTLFSVRYTARYQSESLVRYYPFLLLLFASIVGVVAVRDMLFFIAFWEIMTLTSYALVVFERGNEISLRAGFIYFLVTHVATACLIIAAIMLYVQTQAPHSFGFTALKTSLEMLVINHSGLVHIVLALFFIGFVTKAGILPFGFWLPAAYTVAPSGASAAFAGTMTKLGIYGVVRVFCELLPISHYSYMWGQVIAIFGAISIFVGTMSALTQDDSKRLMSFHVIGQIGYMFLGVGLGIFLLPINPAQATMALISGIFHLLNHTMYKPCLFLNAGSILYKTGTRDLNKVGGLLKVMPFTATTAIIASLSIAGVPPFSGFSSKLMIFESSIMSGIDSPHFIILGIVAIFISAVTLASFLKFLNSAFLGKLHVEGETDTQGDVPLSMKIPQGLLAFFCLLFGVVPWLPVRMIYSAISYILPVNYSPASGALLGTALPGFSLNSGQGTFGIWNPLWFLIAMVTLFALGFFISKAGMARTREAETWYGGREHAVEHVRYVSHSFYNPFKQLFVFTIGGIRFEGMYPRVLYPPRVNLSRIISGIKTISNIDQWLYFPFARGFLRLSRWFSRVHVGIPQVYILWIIIGVIAAMIVLFALPAG